MAQGRDNHTSALSPLTIDRWVLVGICGAGMQSFYGMLTATNAQARLVIGTDIVQDQLREFASTAPGLKLAPWDSDWSSLLTPDTVVVHSVAVPPSSPVHQAARRVGCQIVCLPQALGMLLTNDRQVCIAGTHGKTTTTGVVSWILRHSGREKTRYIGGELVSSSHPTATNSPAGDQIGDWAVVESCEYRDSFLSLTPEVAVLTGVEPDHFDFFRDLNEQRSSFERFIARSKHFGSVVVNLDCQFALDIAIASGRRVVTFSADQPTFRPSEISQRNAATLTPDWTMRLCPSESQAFIDAASFTERRFQQQVELSYRGATVAELTLSVPGRHNRQNLLAGIVASIECGVSVEDAVRFASTFRGMKRRFEYRGHWNQIHWIDDYAHHPTAICETLRTAHHCFPNSRIIAVVEPHQVSRLENLFENYANSLTLADEVLVLPVLAARENASLATCQRLSGRLVRAISESGGRALLAANLDQVHGRLDHAAGSGDVVITMGAGRTHIIHDEIHRRLQRNSAA